MNGAIMGKSLRLRWALLFITKHTKIAVPAEWQQLRQLRPMRMSANKKKRQSAGSTLVTETVMRMNQTVGVTMGKSLRLRRALLFCIMHTKIAVPAEWQQLRQLRLMRMGANKKKGQSAGPTLKTE